MGTTSRRREDAEQHRREALRLSREGDKEGRMAHLTQAISLYTQLGQIGLRDWCRRLQKQWEEEK